MQNRLRRTWTLLKLPALGVGIGLTLTPIVVLALMWKGLTREKSPAHDQNKAQAIWAARHFVSDARPHTIDFFGVRAFGRRDNYAILGMRQQGGGPWMEFNVQVRRVGENWRLIGFSEEEIPGSGPSDTPHCGGMNDTSPDPPVLTAP